jgi:hypothetical protein
MPPIAYVYMLCQSVGEPTTPVTDAAESTLRCDQLRADVEALSCQLQTQDFVDIDEQLHQLEKKVREAIEHNGSQDSLLEVQRQIWGITAFMGTEPVCSRAREQKTWVAAGLDRSLLTTDPEAVHFAVSTKLINTISMYASSPYLEGESLTIKAVHGRALFKVEGEWKPYSEVKDQIQYSEELHRFLGWNFIHPDGFVRKDGVAYDQVYPVARLNAAGMAAATDHAKKFWGKDQPEVDPGVEKPFVLQLILTKPELKAVSKAWWSQHLREQTPNRHTSFRLITPDGDLYSFGIAIRQQDAPFLLSRDHLLGTGLSNVPVPDYEESRRSLGRTMVALPISQKRAEEILAFVSEANQGLPFNLAQWNCAQFAEKILHIAGIEVTSRISFGQLIEETFPRISDIPYIGKAASALLAHIPGARVWNVLESVCAQIAACVGNGVALAFFGADTSCLPQDQPQFSHFQQLLSWKDVWRPEAVEIHSPAQLERWMVQQNSVLVF